MSMLLVWLYICIYVLLYIYYLYFYIAYERASEKKMYIYKLISVWSASRASSLVQFPCKKQNVDSCNCVYPTKSKLTEIISKTIMCGIWALFGIDVHLISKYDKTFSKIQHRGPDAWRLEYDLKVKVNDNKI